MPDSCLHRSLFRGTNAIAAIVLAVGLTAFVGVAAQTPPDATPVQPAPLSIPYPYPSPLPTGHVTYRTLSETYNEMEQLADSFPERVVRFELPRRSLLGQRMWGLEISHNVKASSGKPVFLMTSLHHGDEWPTVELVMEFAHDMLKNDGADTLITSLLDKARLVLIPVVNPDGYDISRNLIYEDKRKNCRVDVGRMPTWAECGSPANSRAGVDLNRNYGAFWGGVGASMDTSNANSRGETPFSEPEIQNIRDLMWSNQVTVALNNHVSGAYAARLPNTPEEPAPADVAPYDSLAQAIGSDLKWGAGSGMKFLHASGIMDQTAYYSAGTLAFTFETTPEGLRPPYSFVIDQYFGRGAYPGSSARAGFLKLFAAAAAPTLHSVLRVRAPAGALLTIRKHFTMETAPVLNADTTKGPPLTFPVALTSSLTVPRGVNEVTWHINPSSRPSQHAKELIPGAWTLTCTWKNGRSRSVEVAVARGKVAMVDMRRCQEVQADGRGRPAGTRSLRPTPRPRSPPR